MYIEPDTNIKILKNVPLDTTYKHTLYFSDKSEQQTYFSSLRKYNLTQQSYQRVERGVSRVNYKAEDLYDCNYMMFQNSSFGTKWFYAFITSVEYVNNVVSEIKFEIDVLQTWFFDYILQESFVEREHSVSDNMWENTVDENLEIGDYITNKKDTFDLGEMNVCIVSSKHSDGSTPTVKLINGVLAPLNYVSGVPVSDINSVKSLFTSFTDGGHEDWILNVYQYPKFFGDAETTAPVTEIKAVTPNFNNINGYVPKNKKLFVYPYNMLLVSNNNGETAEYKWELFNYGVYNEEVTIGQFNITGVFVGNPCALCYPSNYRGNMNDYDSGITISNFPQIPWIGDAYQRWLEQNKGALASSIIGTAVSTINSAQYFGRSGAILNGINQVSDIVGRIRDAKATPPQVHGQITCDTLNIGIGRCEFSFYHMQIKPEYARIIDNYFTMYGYATHVIKVPNINSRPHWNYVKTIDCNITGSVPSNVAKKICEIFDSGITFWKNGSEVGNYSLDNRP